VPPGEEGGRVGYRVRLKFAVPITGPIILGYTAHYGLGAMTPVREWVGVSRSFRSTMDWRLCGLVDGSAH